MCSEIEREIWRSKAEFRHPAGGENPISIKSSQYSKNLTLNFEMLGIALNPCPNENFMKNFSFFNFVNIEFKCRLQTRIQTSFLFHPD